MLPPIPPCFQFPMKASGSGHPQCMGPEARSRCCWSSTTRARLNWPPCRSSWFPAAAAKD